MTQGINKSLFNIISLYCQLETHPSFVLTIILDNISICTYYIDIFT